MKKWINDWKTRHEGKVALDASERNSRSVAGCPKSPWVMFNRKPIQLGMANQFFCKIALKPLLNHSNTLVTGICTAVN